MYIRRIYFNKSTDEVLLEYMSQGEISIRPVSEDFRIQPQLKGFSQEEVGVFEFTKPDDEEQFIDKLTTIVSGELVLIDTEPEITEFEEGYMQALLDLMELEMESEE